MLFQYIMLDLLKEQLDQHTITTDIKFGEGLIFSEITPHKVGTDFKPSGDTTAREVLTLWLIEKDSKLDNEFIDDVIAFPEDGVINQIETKVSPSERNEVLICSRNTSKDWNASALKPGICFSKVKK